MMLVSNVLPLVLALTAGTSAFPTFGLSSDRVSSLKSSVVESINAPPQGWVKDDIKFDKDASMIELRIQLVHQDMDKFHELAMNVCSNFLLLQTHLRCEAGSL